MTKASLERIAAVLAAARTVVLTTHRSPDGDGLGACLGLAQGLDKLGKEVTVFNADACPAALAFLPGAGRLTDRLPAAADAAVVFDCAEPERVADGLTARLAARDWIVLDHHATERDFTPLTHNDPDAPASAELALRVLKLLGAPLDAPTATCLYAGLAVDTGTFRFSNATARAFAAAAELTAAGANASEVAHFLFEEQPPAKLKLTAAVLATLEVALAGKLCTLAADDAMLAATGAGPAELDGLVNYPRALAGCAVAALYFTGADGVVRVSLRTSIDAVDVESVARVFGGGGHKHAAGCSMPGPLPQARVRLAAEVERMLARVGA